MWLNLYILFERNLHFSHPLLITPGRDLPGRKLPTWKGSWRTSLFESDLAAEQLQFDWSAKASAGPGNGGEAAGGATAPEVEQMSAA